LYRRRHRAGRQQTDFAVTDRVQNESAQSRAHGRKIVAQDRDFQIVVNAGCAPQPQVDRPAADDTPRDIETGQPFGCLFGPPGAPRIERRTVAMFDA
jgi:hypothetical protein